MNLGTHIHKPFEIITSQYLPNVWHFAVKDSCGTLDIIFHRTTCTGIIQEIKKAESVRAQEALSHVARKWSGKE